MKYNPLGAQYAIHWDDFIGTIYTAPSYGDGEINKLDLYIPAASSQMIERLSRCLAAKRQFCRRSLLWGQRRTFHHPIGRMLCKTPTDIQKLAAGTLLPAASIGFMCNEPQFAKPSAVKS